MRKKKVLLPNLQKSLEKANDRIFYLETILAQMPGNVYWKDRNGRYQFCNINAANLVGFKSNKDVVGKKLHDFVEKKYADEVIAVDEEIIRTNQGTTIEEKAFDLQGNPAIYLTKKQPLHDQNGKVSGLYGISMNITELKSFEMSKQEIEKEASKKTTQAVEMLAGSLAHELRTPLAIINLNLDLLLANRPDLFIKQNDYAEKVAFFNKAADNIKFSVITTTHVIDMILTKLKNAIQNNITPEQFGQCSIRQCIDEALAAYPFHKNETGLINWDKDNKDFNFKGNNILTKHIIFNLIKNSLYAIKENNHGKIFISTKIGKKYNQLIFKDTGKGITKNFLPKLFTPFVGKNNDGTGLGLAFSKMVIESFGGTIQCKSIENSFSEFILNFPK